MPFKCRHSTINIGVIAIKSFAVLAAGLVAISGMSALAQTVSVSGTPSSPYSYAAPYGIRDGCHTVNIQGTISRAPADCTEAPSTGRIGAAPAQPLSQGTVMSAPAVSDIPSFAYPFAAPHEIRGGCRTVLLQGTTSRAPVNG